MKDEERKMYLARVLDMDEIELRAALIEVVNGIPADDAIDVAWSCRMKAGRQLRRMQEG